MKRTFITLACMALLISCKKEKEPTKQDMATLKLKVELQIEETKIPQKLKAAQAISEYLVMIMNASNDTLFTYNRFADMPNSIELAPGNYSVVAYSNNVNAAEFDNPCYRGEVQVNLAAGETRTENITCSLVNCAVEIIYAPQVATNFDAYYTTVANTQASLIFDETESRYGYYSIMPLSIQATLNYTRDDNSLATKTLSGNINAPAAGRLYRITINTTRDINSLGISIENDSTFVTEDITITDEVEPQVPGVGDLIISEIMANPAAKSDTYNEYIEIYNTTSAPLNLNGLVYSNGSQDVTIDVDTIVDADGYFTIARNTDSVAFEANYQGNVGLTNGGDVLILSMNTGGTLTDIFSLDYGDGFPDVEAGASLELSTQHLNATDAVNGSAWCTAVSEIGDGDLGTPGSANDCSTLLP